MHFAANCYRLAYGWRRNIAKTLLVMKLTSILLLAGLLQVSARGFSQHVTLNASKISLAEVFEKAEAQTGYYFLFKEKDLEGLKLVSVDVANMPVEEFLRKILAGQPLEFTISEKNVAIFRKMRLIYEMAGPIDGVVRSADGAPLAGASVRIKGTKKGTVTDAEGRFSLSVDPGEVLIVSFTGYNEKEIKVGNDAELIVTLQLKENALGPVTISGGYYKTTDKMKTGSIAKVTAKEIENQPVTSLLMVLQGRMPGVQVTPTSGAPGAAVNIRVRGLNSIRTSSGGRGVDGNAPLYVVDGVPLNSMPIVSNSLSLTSGGMDPLSTLNPNNIESIEVLKDADATSIYGSRGANGVILITTKDRKQRANLSVDLGVYRGFGEVTSRVEMMNTEQYLAMRHEAIRLDGAEALDEYNHPDYGAYYFPDLLVWDTTRYTDWQDVLLGNTSQISDVQLNLGGSTGRTSYGFGGSYHHETLLYPGDFGYKRFTGNFNLNHASLNDRFRFSFGINYGVDENKLFDSQSLMGNALGLVPSSPNLYNPDGTLNWAPMFNTSTWMNPLSWVRSQQKVSTHNFMTNAGLEYDILKDLTLSLTGGFSRMTSKEVLNLPISAADPYDPWNLTGSSLRSSTMRSAWIMEPKLFYRRSLGNGHTLNALAGLTLQQSTGAQDRFAGRGYTSDALLGTLAGAKTLSTSINTSQYRYGAVYGRVGYDYKNKYLINLTARRDGSSRFGPDNQYGTFGAVGAAWIFSNEEFISNALSPFLSFGKIRVSYGSTGNDQIGDSKYVKTYQASGRTYHGNIGLEPSSLFNADYAWELTRKLEGAVELGFLNDHISLEVATFRNRSSNQLVQYTLPLTTGFTNVWANFEATIENTGWEFAIRARAIDKPDFKWDPSFNVSFSRNKLVAFPGIETSPYATQFKVGESLDIKRTYLWTGVDPQTGVHTFKDLNGDGNITWQDQDFSRALNTLYFGGFNNSFSWRGIELNFLLQINEAYANTAYFIAPGMRANQPVSRLNRWQKPGDITNVMRFTTRYTVADAYYRWQTSDEPIQKVSFIRLKTLSLGYNFKPSLLRRAGMKQAKIFLQGQNLLTFTDFDGWDPQTLYGIPPLRILSAGLQAKF